MRQNTNSRIVFHNCCSTKSIILVYVLPLFVNLIISHACIKARHGTVLSSIENSDSNSQDNTYQIKKGISTNQLISFLSCFQSITKAIKRNDEETKNSA